MMMNILLQTKRGLFTLFSGLVTFTAVSQSIPKFDIKNILATSPEAAMLGRFGETPIGFYTGTADVSIPLYTIKEGGLEVPIMLRYHGSGNKVEDQASNVGLGWSMEPGGAIIQVVNGKPDADDLLVNTNRYNFLKNTDPGYPAITSPFTPRYADRYPIGNGLFSQECIIPSDNQDSYQTLIYLEQGHGQPDIYQYNFPGGYSGKFYINPENGSIVLIDKKQDITFINLGAGWKAITMDGNAYYFDVRETAGPSGDLNTLNAITYKLSKITLHNGKEINFSYQDGYYDWVQYSESFHSAYPGGMGGGLDNVIVPTSTTTQHHVKTLTGISGNNIAVVFNLGSRIDMPLNTGSNPNVKRINSVDIKNATTGVIIKSFNFNYDYFTSTGSDSYLYTPPGTTYVPSDADAKRLKLLSVQEIGYNASGQPVTNPPYNFSYDESVSFPLKTSYSRDFWGYYNGQANNKLLPDLSFFYYSDDQTYQYSNAMPLGLLTSYQGANRSPDSTKMKVGLLKKITYPTGGSTAFAYEPHNFGNHAYPDIQKIRNANQSIYVSDTNQSSDTKSVNFTLNTGQSLTFNLSITRGPNTSVTFEDMQPSNIVLTKTLGGVTTTVKIWQLFVDDRDAFNAAGGNKYFTGPDATVVLVGEPGTVYTLTCNLPDALGPQGMASNAASVSASFNYLNFPPDYKNSYGAGMRIATIINYTSNGDISSKKIIKYLNTDNTPSGILMSPLVSLYSDLMFSLQGGLNVIADKLTVWKIASESVVAFSDGAQGNLVGYSRVEENDVAPDNTIKGKHIYTYYNAPSQWAINEPDSPSPLNGMINTDEIYNNSFATPIQKSTYTYASLQNTAFSGYKTSQTYLGSLDVPCGGYTNNGAGVDPGEYRHNMLIHIYPIYGYWYKPSGKTTEITDNGATVSAIENYAYNSKGQLIQTDTYNSKQQKRSVKNLFPIDNPSDPMSSQLISLGLYNDIQEQKLMQNDNTELSKSNVYYKMESGQAVQNYITRSNNAAAAYIDITFDKYLDYKTLVQFTEKSSPVCLIWSFNYTKPVAEVKNMDHATLESILGLANIKAFAANPNPSATDINSFLNPLRNAVTGTRQQVISYTYSPLVGMTSMTDAKGQTTTYEYDSFQRLLNIRDQYGNIVKHTDYHYQNQ